MEEKKLNIVDKIKMYIKETQTEAKKVAWPDRRYVLSATFIIVFLVVAISLALMIMDYGLSNIIVFLTRAR